MNTIKCSKIAAILVAVLAVSGCSDNKSAINNISGDKPIDEDKISKQGSSTFWEGFRKQDNQNKIAVNKYIWLAAVEVVDFLPIKTVDPFTGVIVTGYGTPPNGGRSYRATILINDPALDARSLNVSLQTRGGAASTATVRAIEDAILSRARQLRVQEDRL